VSSELLFVLLHYILFSIIIICVNKWKDIISYHNVDALLFIVYLRWQSFR